MPAAGGERSETGDCRWCGVRWAVVVQDDGGEVAQLQRSRSRSWRSARSGRLEGGDGDGDVGLSAQQVSDIAAQLAVIIE